MRPPEHPPGHLNKTKYYDVRVVCTNCGETQHVQITKGTKVDQVLQDFDCENCGCTGTLEKA